MLFSVKGPMDSSTAKSKRVKLPVSDGSTVSYDIFEPAEGPVEDVVLFMLPGINNSSESDYMQSFAANATKNGYRCAIFNYIGILNEPISGNRVFTYGGTGDVYLMYQDLLSRYGHNVKFAGIGYSMGACVLLRFLGERDEFQRKFVCAFSFCQGYSPLE
jgi:predicted alpha/beta-fold hydrolase